jgi:uncharacterized protein with HEPN domain
MIVGEACRALSGDFRTRHPDEVWVLAAGLRNVIVHEYFGVDLEVVWRVIERDLPGLKEKALEMRWKISLPTGPDHTPVARPLYGL